MIPISYWKVSREGFLSFHSALSSNFYPMWSYPTSALSMVRTLQANNHWFWCHSSVSIASWLCHTSIATHYLCSLSQGSCPFPPIFSSLYNFELLSILTLDNFSSHFGGTMRDLIFMDLIFDIILRLMIVRQLPHLIVKLLITFLEGWFKIMVLMLSLEWEILLGKAMFC